MKCWGEGLYKRAGKKGSMQHNCIDDKVNTGSPELFGLVLIVESLDIGVASPKKARRLDVRQQSLLSI